MQVSKCCGVGFYIKTSRDGRVSFYECDFCYQPCDLKEKSEKEDNAEKVDESRN